MRKHLLLISIISIIFLIQLATAESPYSSNEGIVSSGGGNVSGSSYVTDVAVSQLIGNTSSSNYESGIGFFYAIQNNAPEWSIIPNQTWNQDTSTTINLSAYVSDIDNDDLTYSSTTPENIAVSINQTIGVATLTPSSGFYGTRYIVFHANDYADNVSSNNLTLTINQAVAPEAGVGAGVRGAPTRRDFSIDKDIIKLLLRQGETKREQVTVKNTGNRALSFVVDIGQLKEFVVVDEYAFELKAGETKTLKFDFFAAERQLPDVYTGRISIKGNGTTKTINAIIDVLPKEAMFDISLVIFRETKEIKPSRVVKANITIINLGDLRDIDVELALIIKDMENNVKDSGHETLAILGDRMEIVREFKTADDIKTGDYVLYAKLSYKGIVVTASDLFTVIEIKKPTLIHKAKEFFITNWIYFAVIAGILLAILISIPIARYVHKKYKQKRYKRKKSLKYSNLNRKTGKRLRK